MASLVKFALIALTLSHVNIASAQAEPLPYEVVAGYNVFLGTEPTKLSLYDIVVGKTELLLTDLEPNTTYYISVQAFNEEGVTSGMSPQIKFTTEESTAPGAPSGLTIDHP